MIDEPFRDGNFWFKAGTPQDGVLACYNQIVLLDRRKVQADVVLDFGRDYLRDIRGRRNWAVYDASNTRYYGEWLAHGTRKAAIKDFVDRALSRPRCPLHDMIRDTIVEDALRERQQYFEEARKYDHTVDTGEGT